MTEGIINQIPNKADHAIYCIYTDYEKDYTKPYTTILGCKVNSLDTIPEGMVGKIIESSDYSKQTIKGNLAEGIVYNEWLKIWNMISTEAIQQILKFMMKEHKTLKTLKLIFS